jgi:D-3-phosphoglycerate dehydrogenase
MKIINDKAIVIGLEKINLKDFPKLEVIGCNMTSVEHLPWKEIHKRNIKVISLKGETEFLSTIFSTAEHTIGLMIALLRNYKTALNAPYKDREEYKGHTLYKKTITLIGGDGRIGSQVSNRLKAFGCNVYRVGKDIPQFAITTADIISIHIPLQENEGFFTKEMFQKMKSSACIINTSRGRIIEKGALLWALENKIISGAAVDFIEDEDLVAWAETHKNLILTNHQGGNTQEDREATEKFIINKINEYLNGTR